MALPTEKGRVVMNTLKVVARFIQLVKGFDEFRCYLFHGPTRQKVQQVGLDSSFKLGVQLE